MFWIIGGDFLAHYLYQWTGAPALGLLSTQLTHAEWAGFHAYDLVFPLFMFLSGVSAGLVMERAGRPASKAAMLKRAARRAATLIALGVVYNWGWRVDVAEIRFASVLGLIGGAYFISISIMLALDGLRGRLLALLGVLACVAALQLFATPAPGFGAGALTAEGSVNSWIDQTFLPGRLHGGSYDPEGLLGVFSGAAITLAGGLVGAYMMRRRLDRERVNIWLLALLGAGLVLAGLAISPFYPPIKKLWTATFNIMSIGFCLMLLAFAVAVFDRGRLLAARYAFAVIGANSILIYMAARYFVYPIYQAADANEWPAALSAAIMVCVIVVQWLFLRFLYERKLFLRV